MEKLKLLVAKPIQLLWSSNKSSHPWINSNFIQTVYFVFVCYLAGLFVVVPDLSESPQTSFVKPGTSRVAQAVDTYMSLDQHPWTKIG